MLNGGNNDDLIRANDGDTVTGGAGADLIEALGFDQTGEAAIVVTDFDPDEDVLMLAQSQGDPLSIEADDSRLDIRAATNGTDTEVVFDGVVCAVLQNTNASALAADTNWLANVVQAAPPAPLPAVPETPASPAA